MSAASYLITGCSGGGKSTLLDAIARRGHSTVPEPGMRIIDNGGPYPWENLPGFLKATMSLARRDLELAPIPGKLRFFDRGLIDALAGVERSGGPRVAEQLNGWRPYDPLIFLAPPWQEIYTTNALRRHDFDEAVREFEQLAALLPSLGYCCIELPKVSAEDRADFVLGQIPGN